MTQAASNGSADDAELVREARRGSVAAYAELVRRWSARVLAVCHARVRRRDVAEELAQETLLRGFQSLATLESPERFGSWLRGIAQRVCLDWLKAKQTGQVTFTELPTDKQPDGFLTSDVDGSVDRADEVRHLMSTVEKLPDEFREVLMLYYYQDATYQELAETLNVSSATINARLTKARAMLRERLIPKTGADESRCSATGKERS
jgi:RNA polymerase sigma-70 factor, ECF subfamily